MLVHKVLQGLLGRMGVLALLVTVVTPERKGRWACQARKA